MQIKILNNNKLIEKLELISNLNLTSSLTKAALLVENSAKENAPVDTGALRSSITHNVEPQQAEVGTNLEYAPYVEIGTGIFSSKGTGRKDRWCYQSADGQWHSTIGHKPQPFLQPALDSNKSEIKRVISEEIDKELKNIARR